MYKPDESQSREIRVGILERKYPDIKKQVHTGEVLLAVSMRKPPYLTGGFCIFVGAIVTWQMCVFFISANPLMVMIALPPCIFAMLIGIRMVIFVKKECVFVTDSRIAYMKLDLRCRMSHSPFSIPLSEVSGVRLFKASISIGAKRSAGDISIKRNGKTYLIPTMRDGVDLVEVIISELKRDKECSIRS